jgi:hypothetical protein
MLSQNKNTPPTRPCIAGSPFDMGLEACTKHYSPAVSEAAKKLKILLNEQTSAVYNILIEALKCQL